MEQTIIIALCLGMICYILSKKLKIPAILFYLVAGIAAGPLGFDSIHPKLLGHGLTTLVEIAVAIILFEGALSLPSQGFEKVPVALQRIFLISIPLTGIGSAYTVHYFLGVSLKAAIFFGAIIIVTGPTVISPILKSITVKNNIEVILRFEAIWGDCIGVLFSAIALKFLVMDNTISHKILVTSFVSQVILGILLGVGGGVLIGKILLPWVSKLGDQGLPSMTSLASALGIFWFSNHLVESSGPLCVAVTGFTISYLNEPYLKDIRHFKDQVAMLFISMLFVLLSAFINPFDYIPLLPKMVWVAVILGIAIRPFSIMLALIQTPISIRERLFISFMGPRGIIAIAVASYASLALKGNQLNTEMNIIVCTIFIIIFILGAFATLFGAGLAKVLKVSVSSYESGLILVGINPFSMEIAKFAINYVKVKFIDTNPSQCDLIDEEKGIEFLCRNALDDHIYSEFAETGFRRAIVLTPNDALNSLVVNHIQAFFGSNSVFKSMASQKETAIDQSIKEHHTLSTLAFDKKFNFIEASQKISEGKAIFVEKEASLSAETDIPIFEIKEKGIKIVRAGSEIEGKVLYYAEQKKE
ncbi:MAG: cation:proton antiporter [Desulfobacterales bacterium]|nr:cation:proton antiporter [Desulfobacterales bacterium]